MDKFLKGGKISRHKIGKHLATEKAVLSFRILEQQRQLAALEKLRDRVEPLMTGPNACKTVGEALEKLKQQEREK